jgi:hypothetical protein
MKKQKRVDYQSLSYLEEISNLTAVAVALQLQLELAFAALEEVAILVVVVVTLLAAMEPMVVAR